MTKDLFNRYAPITVCLYKKNAEGALIKIGTAFFIAAKGYLLTAAELTPQDELVISFRTFEKGYFQTIQSNPVGIPVSLRQYGKATGLALLKTAEPISQTVPLKLFDLDEELIYGNAYPSLIYNQHGILTMRQAPLSAKIFSGAKKIYIHDLIDSELASGAPIFNPISGLICAVVNRQITKRLLAPMPDLTYAIAIEHALDLISAENFYVR